MAYLHINPRYQPLLQQQGLTSADAVLALPGVIVCGHPDRNVARVTLGEVSAFLKREHCVRWKDRLRNLVTGFGLVCRSAREAGILAEVQQAGLSCPDVIAHGEDGRGRAFLLVRELTGAVDLRVYLLDRLYARSNHRLRLAAQLGEELARIHDAGFDHPDLYSKHVLIDRADGSIHFLDWQRSRRRQPVSWQERYRDLAALDATLAEELATSRERLFCLRAYLRATLAARIPPRLLRQVARRIRRRTQRLLRRRAIREARQVPVAEASQCVIWLDGEAACVTRRFWDDFYQLIPAWLPLVSRLATPRNQRTSNRVSLAMGRQALLVRRRTSRPLGWLWSWLCGRPLLSPEVRRVGLLFRLQRFGISTPQVLAFGQRSALPWEMDSFLLTEPVPDTLNLASWLADQRARHVWTAERKQRWQVMRLAADLLRRMHDANCYFGERPTAANDAPARLCPLMVQLRPGGPVVVLEEDPGIRARRRSSATWGLWDLAALRQSLPDPSASRTDELRFLLAYLGLNRLTPSARELARRIMMLAGRPWPTVVPAAPALRTIAPPSLPMLPSPERRAA